MTPFKAAKILSIDERISRAATSGWTSLREEIVRVRLELTNIIRQAKKSHHPDKGGNSEIFQNIDIAARYFAEANIRDIVQVFIVDAQTLAIQNFIFCSRCNGTTQFRGSKCSECNGRGTVYANN
jgi:DnaJ-class molecular chaperone